MDERIEKELILLRREYPALEYKEINGIGWILIPAYKLPPNIWNFDCIAVCFQIPSGYPGNPPYGFFIKTGLLLKLSNEKPSNAYSDSDSAQTPFDGTWGKFSWQNDNSWRPTSDLNSGSNLLNFVRSFNDRFKEGK